MPINSIKTSARGALPAVTQKKQVVPEGVLVSTVNSFLDEGVLQNQSKDYVTDRICKLFQENSATAQKMKLPMEYKSIRENIVEPHYAAIKQKETMPFDLSKTADCLALNKEKIAGLATACGLSFVPVGPLPVRIATGIVSCGTDAVLIAACIQDGKEATHVEKN